MKRFKIGLLLATLYAASVFAQENANTEPAPVVQQASKFHIGTRLGLGASAMRGHKAQRVPSNNQKVVLWPALSMSGGVAFAIEISNQFAIAPELQYAWYRANGEKTHRNIIGEAGINLHSFEMPILARLGFGSMYVEVGPQVGYNVYANLYKDCDREKLKTNDLAFGPSLGFGVNMGETLLGVRTHFGLFEYAKNTNGYPWAVQVSATRFFF